MKNIETFIKKANKIHNNKYNYSKSIYIGSLLKIEIICPIHGSFWQRAASHLRGHNCKQCKFDNQFLNTEKFIIMAKKIHNNKYNYSKSIYSYFKNKVIIICPHHGEFEQSIKSHLSGSGCLKCSRDANKIGREQFIKRANEIHNNKYNYEQVNYITNRIPVIIICSIHGAFKSAPADHLKNSNCHKCSREEHKKKITMTTEEFIQKANVSHNNFYSYNQTNYKHSHMTVVIICPKHGNFNQNPSNHLRGTSCPKCSSTISKISMEWLDYLNIPNDQQHREVRLKLGKRKIRADGFVSKTNTVYEFYGDYFHGNPFVFRREDKSGLSGITYGELYDNTIKRENIIRDAGYNIISIWENDWKKEQTLCRKQQ